MSLTFESESENTLSTINQPKRIVGIMQKYWYNFVNNDNTIDDMDYVTITLEIDTTVRDIVNKIYGTSQLQSKPQVYTVLTELTVDEKSAFDELWSQDEINLYVNEFVTKAMRSKQLYYNAFLKVLPAFIGDRYHPLIIKEPPVTATSVSATSATSTTGTDNFPRVNVINNIKYKLSCGHLSLIIAAPASSGKSTVLSMLSEDEEIKSQYNVQILNCMYFPLRINLRNAGLSIDSKISYQDPFNNGKKHLLILDDIQSTYNDLRIWALIKDMPKYERLQIIYSGIHILDDDYPCAATLTCIPRIGRSEMILSWEESLAFLTRPLSPLFPLYSQNRQETRSLIEAIATQCGGLIGALYYSAATITGRKDNEFFNAVQSFFSGEVLSQLTNRCFTLYNVPPEMIPFLQEAFIKDIPLSEVHLNQEQKGYCVKLVKAGIFQWETDEMFSFSSVMAKRVIFNRVFPNRFGSLPNTLDDLLKQCLARISSSVLRTSQHENDFPKEATWQHLFFRALIESTPPSCSILPELSTSFSGVKVAGEIDFFVNSFLQWGLELLVSGRGIGEHQSRFLPGGAYSLFECNDYVVVDFRHNPTGSVTNVQKNPKRATLFFKTGDYSKCEFLSGSGSVTTVHLAL